VRSDIYSLSVLFYEFLCLQHPRRQHTTLAAMISSVVSEPITKSQVVNDFMSTGTPAVLAHFVRHGLEHEPAARYQSVAEMRARLDAVRNGKAPVECHITLTQRALHGLSHSVDRHPWRATVVMSVLALGFLGFVVLLVRMLLH
jgi:serine/threonine protein kinase